MKPTACLHLFIIEIIIVFIFSLLLIGRKFFGTAIRKEEAFPCSEEVQSMGIPKVDILLQCIYYIKICLLLHRHIYEVWTTIVVTSWLPTLKKLLFFKEEVWCDMMINR